MTFNNDVTIGIKTFFRRPCLRRCIASIRKFYPTVQIIIADDSPRDIQEKNVKEFGQMTGIKILGLSFDVGLSAGRNAIVKECKTKYLQIVDDDTIFKKDTNINIFYQFLENQPHYNLIGGNSATRKHGYVCTYLEIRGRKLYLRRQNFGIIPNDFCHAVKTHRCLNYFMARINALRDHLWDPRLKIAEHEDFFVRAWINKKLTVAFTPDVIFYEKRQVSERYHKYRRKRVHKYLKLAEQYTYKCVEVKNNPPPKKKKNKKDNNENNKDNDNKKDYDNFIKKKDEDKKKKKKKKKKQIKMAKDWTPFTNTKVKGPNGQKKIIKKVNVIKSNKDYKKYKKLKNLRKNT